jgi:hypothetical protein
LRFGAMRSGDSMRARKSKYTPWWCSRFNATFSRHNFYGDLVAHAIDTIAEAGSERSLPRLRVLSEDSTYGARAVSALSALQRRGIGST